MIPVFASLGPHAAYILISYAVAAVVLGALILSSLRAYRSARRRLSAMSSRDDVDAA